MAVHASRRPWTFDTACLAAVDIGTGAGGRLYAAANGADDSYTDPCPRPPITLARSPPMKPEITYDDFAKIDLRIATVLAAREHPNADKLMLLADQGGRGGKADRGRHSRPLHARATRRPPDRGGQQPSRGHAARRGVARHVAGRQRRGRQSCCCGPIGIAKSGRGEIAERGEGRMTGCWGGS